MESKRYPTDLSDDEWRCILKAARQQKGWSQSDLSERTGVAAHNISALETGSRIMGKRLASKFTEHLDADSTELMIANRVAAMEQATKENDAPTILAYAKAIVGVMRDQEVTDEDEKLLDQLVNEAPPLRTRSGPRQTRERMILR